MQAASPVKLHHPEGSQDHIEHLSTCDVYGFTEENMLEECWSLDQPGIDLVCSIKKTKIEACPGKVEKPPFQKRTQIKVVRLCQ